MRLSLVYPRVVPYAQRRAGGVIVRTNISDVTFSGLRARNVSTTRAVSAGVAEATATAAADAEKLLQSTATKHLPRPIFPWRHEEDLLPRFIPGTPEYLKDLRVPSTFRSITAGCFLNVPWYQLLLSGNAAWEEDIAHSTSWAFAQAVAGVVSDVYKVPLADIALDDKVHFQFPPPEAEGGPVVEEEGDKKTDSSASESMLARSLRNLFTSAHESGKHQLQIRLEMQPKSTKFYSLFALPFVSRAAVEKDPKLLENTYRNMALMRTSPREGFQNVIEAVERDSKRDGKLSTTIEVQVLVECDEIFQVVDLDTGVVLQGHEDGLVRSVVHLVRMEKTVETYDNDEFPYFPDVRQGNWQITDIDDLLGPKKWYLI
jgi:hypothetical protein